MSRAVMIIFLRPACFPELIKFILVLATMPLPKEAPMRVNIAQPLLADTMTTSSGGPGKLAEIIMSLGEGQGRRYFQAPF